MELTKDTYTNSFSSEVLTLDLNKKEVLKKKYEGTQDQIANLAISLHKSLNFFRKRHSEFTHLIIVKNTILHLTVYKNE